MKTFRPLLFALLAFSCQQEKKFTDWPTLGGNSEMQHYSPLDKINRDNVNTMGLAWEYDASSRRGRVQRGLEASPIVVAGKMYTSGAWGVVYALDAKTGKELWRYDPEIDGNYARRACCDVVNRGVQVWKGKVYVGVLDGYLVCLDAATGKVEWRVDTFTDRSRFYTITGPPQVAGNVVVIGNSGGEFGVRGYITAYDLVTGKEAWRFFIVPGDPKNGYEHPEMEAAAKTWDANSDWEAGGGGTVWGESTYDPELNLLFIGTGNSSPYPIWHRSPSGGDNLYLASVLAINPDNGKLKWHYQTTPAEIWDYTCSSTMTLADININGSERKVLMTGPKNGFYYVIDRATGELISAKNFVPVNWASSIDIKTGRPVLTGDGWYKDEAKIIYPGPPGGHSWQPMSFNPKTNIAYIPALHLPFRYESRSEFKYNRDDNTGTMMDPVFDSIPGVGKPDAWLLAWDVVQQKEVWKVKAKLVDSGGGVLSTGGGLVFEGTTDGFFNVYDASTGKNLKSIETGTGIMAAPITYQIDGDQYIAVMAGFGGATLPFNDKRAAMHTYQNNGRILAFKLDGAPTPLPPKVVAIATPAPPEKKLDKELVAKGKILYGKYCGGCHAGFRNQRTSGYPNLAKMSLATHERFNDIVLEGAYNSYGMASFSDVLTVDDAGALHDFLISMQVTLHDEEGH